MKNDSLVCVFQQLDIRRNFNVNCDVERGGGPANIFQRIYSPGNYKNTKAYARIGDRMKKASFDRSAT